MLLAKGCTFGSADSICKLAHQLVCFVFETDTLANVQRDENDDTFRILNENLYIFFQVIGLQMLQMLHMTISDLQSNKRRNQRACATDIKQQKTSV